MSLRLSSSSDQLPKFPSKDAAEQEKNPLTEKEKADEKEAEKNQSSTPDSKKEKKPGALESPRIKPKPPVVRQKLRARERSVSSPLLVRPVANASDQAQPSSMTPDAKSNSASKKSKDADTLAPAPSPKSSSSSTQNSDTSLLSTPPKLRTKNPNTARKSLTPEQQISRDLADLLDTHLLRKAGRADDDIDVSKLALSLQRYAGKTANEKIRIDDLMLKMFSDGMKKSDAWEMARQTAEKIKSAYFFGRDANVRLDEKKEKEAADTLRFLSAGLAGAFFNVSGEEGKIRLPQKVKNFMREVDHRQIRLLLSTDAGLKMNDEAYMLVRKEALANVLLDAFLIPLVLKEFFPARGTIESDTAASYIIESLHTALSVSAPSLLKESIDAASEDITELVKKRRLVQFKSDKNQRSIVGADTTSPNRHRRAELSETLKKAIERLDPEKFSDAMLRAIKSFNNEYALSSRIISDDALYREWLAIAKKIDPKADVVAALQDFVDLDSDMTEIDILAKLAKIEASGEKIVPERARRLSSDMPYVPPPTDTSSTSYTPVSSSTTPSTSSLAIKRKDRRKPGSPTQKVFQHKRSKTADVAMPNAPTNTAPKLAPEERETLIKAFPDLLLECVKRAALVKTETGEKKLNSDPVRAITIAGRNAFHISVKSVPEALRPKVLMCLGKKSDSTTVSHTELLNLLMMESLKSSQAGQIFQQRRSETLRQFNPAVTAEKLKNDDGKYQAVRKKMAAQIQGHVDSILDEIFGKGLASAGLPADLLQVWMDFDQKLLSWVDQYPEMKSKFQFWSQQHPGLELGPVDTLRSELEFDLIVTRLIYPAAVGAMSANVPMSSVRFSDALKNSLKPLWDKKLFEDFKSMQDASFTTLNSAKSTSSTSQTPSKQQ